MIGAYREDSAATGVNGNQSNNSRLNSGAAYVFTGFGRGPQLALEPDNLGGYFIRAEGHVGYTNYLERASSVTGAWVTIDTQITPLSGLVEFHDQSPMPGQAFYRTVQP